MRCILIYIFIQFICLSSQAQLIGGGFTDDNTNLPATRERVKIEYLTLLKTASTTEKRSVLFVNLPLSGKEVLFSARQNGVLVEAGYTDYPGIFTYDIKAEDGSSLRGTMTLSRSGLFATIINGGKLISIYPEKMSDPVWCIIEYGHQPDIKLPKQYCGHDHSNEELSANHGQAKMAELNSGITLGSKRFNYRLAVATTGEFYVKNGNNDNAVQTVVINTVNALNAIYSNELSVKFSLGNRIFLYRNPATDPFIPDETGGPSRPDQAGTVIAMNISQGSYDIGHIFHQHEDGDGWGNGGIAQIRSVCSNSGSIISKARGWSGAYSNTGNGWINLVAHEFGHQFGANHTFNGIGGSCTDAIDDTNAYEIGSGTTIMSYNGICDANQNIPNSDALDNYFHAKSLEEIYNYVYTGTGGSCGNPVTSPNPLPSVNANQCQLTYTIPKNTPFYLKASGTWTDSDNHTYCWEQIDEDGPGTPTQGRVGALAAIQPKAPLFRSYPPSPTPERFFPSLEILRGTGTDPFDVLPNVKRELNFNVAIRDNNVDGGAIANDNIKINVSDFGPFVVSRPIGGEVFQAGQNENIIWNTNGSNSVCNKVRIKLSLDGGLNYNIVIAEGINYQAGTYSFAIPVTFTASTKARIMIECMDFDCAKFFNVSKSDFRINSTCKTEETFVCPQSGLLLDEGDPGLQLNMLKIKGVIIKNYIKSVSNSSPDMPVTVRGQNGVGCRTLLTFKHEKIKVVPEKSGTYIFNTDREYNGGFGFISVFRAANFTTSNPCMSFVGSSGTWTGNNNSVSAGNQFSVVLNECVEYFIAFYNYGTLPATNAITDIIGPGNLIELNTVTDPAYDVAFVAIDQATGLIVAVSSNADFTAIKGGKYLIYSISYAKSQDINSFKGLSLNQIINQFCVRNSVLNRPLEVRSSCKITDMKAGAQSNCVASSNLFTQDIIVSYDKAPASGKLSVNNQLYDVTSSPQTITLTNLDSDGKIVDVTAFFTDAPNCKLSSNALFRAPVNCCPLSFDLGPDIQKCVGESVMLVAGDNGVSYIWKKDGEIISSTNSKTIPVFSSGYYEVEVTHSTGCKKSDGINVTFNPLPIVILATNQKFCEGDIYTLVAATTNAQTFTWYKDNVIINGANQSQIQITDAGLYKLVATTAFNCKGENQTFVSTITLPKVELGPDLKKCEDESAELNAGDDGIKYEWYKDNNLIVGAIQKKYTATQSGIYRVIVTNSDQCKTEDNVKIDFFSKPVIQDLQPLVDICQGTTYTITAQVTDYNTLQWFYDNNIIQGSKGLELIVANSGNYKIEAINLAGCKNSKSTQIEVRSNPVVKLGNDITACDGSTITLDAGTDGTSYKWQKDGILISEVSKNIIVSSNGLYQVTVTNQYNCFSTDKINVTFVSGPTVTLNGDKTICEGTNHLITVSTNAVNPEIRWFKDAQPISGQTDLTLNVTQQGIYEIALKAGTPACEVRKSVQITVNPRPALNLGNDRTLCESDALPVLNGGDSNTSYNWTLNGAPISTEQTVTVKKSGIYEVTVKNSFGCFRTEQVKIIIEPLPLLVLKDAFDLCTGTTIKLDPETNGTRFEWKKDNILIQGVTANTLSVNLPGNYSITAYNNANCKKEAATKVFLRDLPIVDLGADISLCPDAVKILDAGNQTRYVWSDGSTTSKVTINAGRPVSVSTTKFTVLVFNEFGCQSKDSILITKYPIIKATITSDKPGVCNGQPVKITAGGGIKYLWTDPPGNTLSITTGAVTTASPVKTTVYTVQVSDDVCPDNKESKSIEIKVFEPTDISAGKDTCVTIGKTIRLGAKGGTKYEWNNTDIIVGASNVANPVIKPVSDVVFTVTITDANGCIFNDEVNVCVKEEKFKPITIITPNGDGRNDELFFGGLSDYPDNTIKIYNRWGNLIFEAKGYQIRGEIFNGYRNGQRLPADTYYYILTFDDQVIKSALTILWD
jgi:gliding motility-associated-like protein